MPMFACTMFLESDGQDTAWTETWYRTFNDSVAAVAAFTTVANARAACLATGGTMVKIRVSDVAISGDSAEGRQFAYQPINREMSFASVGWLCRYEANDIHRTERIIRGLPAIAFNGTNRRLINDPATAQRINTYHLAIQNAYSFRVKKRAPATPVYTIKSLAYDPVTNTVNVTTLGNHTFAVGDQVNHTGLTQYVKQIRGIQLVLETTATTYRFAVGKPYPEFIELKTPYNGKGRVRKVEYDYPIVARIIDQKWTDRQTGRPFELQVGRQ